GNFATSKKSGLLRWPVSFSSSLSTDAMSISTLTVAASMPLAGTLTLPENLLNAPSCLPVTLAPTNSSFESAWENAYWAPWAVAGLVIGSPAFSAGSGLAVTGSLTLAAGLPAPGSLSQAIRAALARKNTPKNLADLVMGAEL